MAILLKCCRSALALRGSTTSRLFARRHRSVHARALDAAHRMTPSTATLWPPLPSLQCGSRSTKNRLKLRPVRFRVRRRRRRAQRRVRQLTRRALTELLGRAVVDERAPDATRGVEQLGPLHRQIQNRDDLGTERPPTQNTATATDITTHSQASARKFTSARRRASATASAARRSCAGRARARPPSTSPVVMLSA